MLFLLFDEWVDTKLLPHRLSTWRLASSLAGTCAAMLDRTPLGS